jgi:hypothetical protein
MNYKLLGEIQDLVDETPQISSEKKKQIADKIQQARTPLETDKWIYRTVVGALGAAILACLTFSFVLTWQHAAQNGSGDIKIPDIFLAIGSAAVGALAGLLAPSPMHKD